jgi:hypothetical protein
MKNLKDRYHIFNHEWKPCIVSDTLVEARKGMIHCISFGFGGDTDYCVLIENPNWFQNLILGYEVSSEANLKRALDRCQSWCDRKNKKEREIVKEPETFVGNLIKDMKL